MTRWGKSDTDYLIAVIFAVVAMVAAAIGFGWTTLGAIVAAIGFWVSAVIRT